ncbi:uncharacterized protein V1510DRAFT_402002 [Dipodascopsis tothii]|uniref:uncharacterized protein n=1 Tax=Dipodascopsis tothii TaxID=44089 RepID=UPI0034CE768D
MTDQPDRQALKMAARVRGAGTRVVGSGPFAIEMPSAMRKAFLKSPVSPGSAFKSPLLRKSELDKGKAVNRPTGLIERPQNQAVVSRSALGRPPLRRFSDSDSETVAAPVPARAPAGRPVESEPEEVEEIEPEYEPEPEIEPESEQDPGSESEPEPEPTPRPVRPVATAQMDLEAAAPARPPRSPVKRKLAAPRLPAAPTSPAGSSETEPEYDVDDEDNFEPSARPVPPSPPTPPTPRLAPEAVKKRGRPPRDDDGSYVQIKAQKLSERDGGSRHLNEIDVVAQVMSEQLYNAAAKQANGMHRRVLESFAEELEFRFLDMVDAVDAHAVLATAVRRARKKKALLREQLLDLRRERAQISADIDTVRSRHLDAERTADSLNDVHNFLEEIQGVDARARQVHARLPADERARVAAGKTPSTQGVEADLAAVAPLLGPAGLLARVREFNAFLEDVELQM